MSVKYLIFNDTEHQTEEDQSATKQVSRKKNILFQGELANMWTSRSLSNKNPQISQSDLTQLL